jgi:hypothetical protein
MIQKARILFMFIASIAILSVITWNYFPSVIDEVDHQVVRVYKYYHKKKLKNAQELINKGEIEAGASSLASLMSDLKDIEVSDRLDFVKHQGFPVLINALLALNRVDEAFYWSYEWLAFHENDLVAQVMRAEMLIYHSDNQEEGKETLVNLYADFSLSPSVKKAYFRMIEEGVSPLAKKNIYMYWKSGKEKFSEERKSQALIGGAVEFDGLLFDIKLVVGGDVDEFRIDLPATYPVQYSIEALEVAYKDSVTNINPSQESYKYHSGMNINGKIIDVVGSDPRFVVVIANTGKPVEFIRLKGAVK